VNRGTICPGAPCFPSNTSVVRQQPEPESLPIRTQPCEVPLTIRIVPENALPLVATNDHVVQTPRNLHPHRPRHDSNNAFCHD